MTRLLLVSLCGALLLGACRDGTGPTGAGPLTVLRTDGVTTFFAVYGGAGPDATKLHPDSLRLNVGASRAADGRLALVTYLPNPDRYRLTELAPSGAILRAVDLDIANLFWPSGRATPGYLGVSYSPDGKRIAIRMEGSQEYLFILDPGATTLREAARRNLQTAGSERLGYNAPVRWLSATEIGWGAPGTLGALDVTTGATRTIASDVRIVFDYDAAPDGRIAYAVQAHGATGVVLMLQPSREQPAARVDAAGDAVFAVRWSRDGKRIATTAAGPAYPEQPDLRRIRLQVVTPGQTAAPVVVEDVTLYHIHGWTRDGRIAVTGFPGDASMSQSTRDVYLVPARGGASVNATNTPFLDEQGVLLR